MEKVLITGASGLLGIRLVNSLSKDYHIITTHHKNILHPESVLIDIADREQVFGVFNEHKPDITVHAAAETNVDKCETNKDSAWKVNAVGTRNIAEACTKIGTKLIYISTDYIFDGDKGLYQEEDQATPINYYGFTKLKGEESVKELCEDYVIARTSVTYGWHPKKMNFATWIINSLRNQKKISIVQDHYNSPTFTDDLAEIIKRIIKSKINGIYHTAGAERVSRYEFALKIVETFNLEKSLLEPVQMRDFTSWVAKRPRDSSLCINKIQEIGIHLKHLADTLRIMKESEQK